MPLYEFVCHACSDQFESLVKAGERPATCPTCGSDNFERLLSSFGVKTDATSRCAFNKAREAQSKVNREKSTAEREHADGHDDH